MSHERCLRSLASVRPPNDRCQVVSINGGSRAGLGSGGALGGGAGAGSGCSPGGHWSLGGGGAFLAFPPPRTPALLLGWLTRHHLSHAQSSRLPAPGVWPPPCPHALPKTQSQLITVSPGSPAWLPVASSRLGPRGRRLLPSVQCTPPSSPTRRPYLGTPSTHLFSHLCPTARREESVPAACCGLAGSRLGRRWPCTSAWCAWALSPGAAAPCGRQRPRDEVCVRGSEACRAGRRRLASGSLPLPPLE